MMDEVILVGFYINRILGLFFITCRVESSRFFKEGRTDPPLLFQTPRFVFQCGSRENRLLSCPVSSVSLSPESNGQICCSFGACSAALGFDKGFRKNISLFLDPGSL